MRLLVSNAARIVFLGFGFHKQNMELLAPKKLDANKHVFATAFEAPTGEGRRIRDALGARFNFYGQSTVEDDTCDDFASSYVRYLASG